MPQTISAAYKLHLQSPYQQRTRCWLCALQNDTIVALTEHDANITFDLEAAMVTLGLTPPPGIDGTGEQIYLAESGFTGTDIASEAGLNVNTGEAMGLLRNPAITEADLLAGKWDFCRITVFEVIWSSLSSGPRILTYGTIGEVTIDRGFYRAEWRSLMQAYQQNVGRLYSPTCDVKRLGDNRCNVDLTPFSFNFTITGLNADNPLLFYASALTQPGPTGGIAILNISSANPGIVTMASAGSFAENDPVVLATIVGPTVLNGMTRIKDLSGATWSLGFSTTSLPAYVSGGTVTPLGGDSGYFDMGTVLWTAGSNIGRTDVVKQYSTGQVTLQLPTAYAMQVGDTGVAVAGCNRSLAACRDKFNNILNRRAFDYFPGNDALMQVGRHE